MDNVDPGEPSSQRCPGALDCRVGTDNRCERDVAVVVERLHAAAVDGQSPLWTSTDAADEDVQIWQTTTTTIVVADWHLYRTSVADDIAAVVVVAETGWCYCDGCGGGDGTSVPGLRLLLLRRVRRRLLLKASDRQPRTPDYLQPPPHQSLPAATATRARGATTIIILQRLLFVFCLCCFDLSGTFCFFFLFAKTGARSNFELCVMVIYKNIYNNGNNNNKENKKVIN